MKQSVARSWLKTFNASSLSLELASSTSTRENEKSSVNGVGCCFLRFKSPIKHTTNIVDAIYRDLNGDECNFWWIFLWIEKKCLQAHLKSHTVPISAASPTNRLDLTARKKKLFEKHEEKARAFHEKSHRRMKMVEKKCIENYGFSLLRVLCSFLAIAKKIINDSRFSSLEASAWFTTLNAVRFEMMMEIEKRWRKKHFIDSRLAIHNLMGQFDYPIFRSLLLVEFESHKNWIEECSCVQQSRGKSDVTKSNFTSQQLWLSSTLFVWNSRLNRKLTRFSLY